LRYVPRGGPIHVSPSPNTSSWKGTGGGRLSKGKGSGHSMNIMLVGKSLKEEKDPAHCKVKSAYLFNCEKGKKDPRKKTSCMAEKGARKN